MTPRIFLRLAMATACLLAGAASAQTTTPDTARIDALRNVLQQRFAAADSNGDGRLSRDEARAGMPRVYRNFDAIDSAHAGSITLAQIEAYMASQQGQHSGRRP